MKENHGWDFSVSRFLLANTNAGSFSVRCIGKAGVSMIEEEEEYFHFIIFCCHVGKAKVSSGTPFCLHCHVESYVTGQMPILKASFNEWVQ